MSKPLLRIDIANGKYTLVQHEDGGTEILRYGQRWMGSPSGFAGVNAVLAMGYELEELREFKEKTEAEIARKLLEVEITLGNCPPPETSIRQLVQNYYSSPRVTDPAPLADIVLRSVDH